LVAERGMRAMLMRFDPFRDLDRLTHTAFDRQTPGMLAMDAYRHGQDFIVNFDLPGARKDSIELSVEKNVLTVSAERTWTRSDGDAVVASERPQGSFTRQLFLGESLDAEHIRANWENGVLTVVIPVAEKAKPRRVQIETTATPAPVDAAATDASTPESESAAAAA
jgi:HSP20 family protein